MRRFWLFLAGPFWLAAAVAPAATPHGTLLELHSCEVYAGGCVVSSEATSGGRYMLRAWEFTGGSFAGTELAGLAVAVLQSSSDNLAMPEAKPGEAVAYLPQSATAAQREALRAWVQSLPGFRPDKLQTRVVPLRFDRTAAGYSFSAGEAVLVRTSSLEACDTGACGEALWYTPRTPTTVFAVAVDQSSRVAEPALRIRWDDTDKRNVFLAKFGDAAPEKNQFVNAADLCGPADKLF